jgi:dihydroorotate dehydrogenase electron transfer subunit
MKQQTMTILSTELLNRDIYRTVLQGDTSVITAPGQFINIQIPDRYLRRPISIADWNDTTMTIIYKVVGHGTADLSSMPNGTSLDVLTGLGNGFDVDKALAASHLTPDATGLRSSQRPAGAPTESTNTTAPILIGGGIGTPPIYGLAKTLVSRGITPTVITGFGTADDVILQEDFRALGIEPMLMTDDGSTGEKGFVTEALARIAGGAQSTSAGSDSEETYICACGPEPMLRALWNMCPRGQFSFETRMACGFGACMGCSCRTKYGNKRICKDGPVLDGGEIVW